MLDLRIEIPQALRLDLVLQRRHLVGGLVGVIRGDLVVAVEQRLLVRDALHHIAENVRGRIEFGLLRQIADAHAVGRPGFAGEFLVEPGHDPQKRRFARAVDADDADLGAGKELQPDVLQDLACRRDRSWTGPSSHKHIADRPWPFASVLGVSECARS